MFRLHALGAAAGHRARTTGLPDRTRYVRQRDKGPRGGHADREQQIGNQPCAKQPTIGRGAIVRHRVPVTSSMGAARHAPPHRIPSLNENLPTLGGTAHCKVPHGGTPST